MNGKENQEVDMIWEYEGPQEAMPAEFESEDILLEMERLLYEDLREEMIRKGSFLCILCYVLLKCCNSLSTGHQSAFLSLSGTFS